jgi:putative aldouronate transport system permease protein
MFEKSNNKKAKFWLYNDFQRNKPVYLMAIPMFLFYLIFKYVPMGGLVIAFQKYNLFKGFWGSQWIGLENFIRFFTGPYVFRLIKNTVLINFYSIFFGFPVPIIFALMLNEVKPGLLKKTIQTISYMPHFISLVVVCGLITDFSRIDGVFNAFLSNFGLKPVNLLSEAGLFRIIFVGSFIWQTIGWSSIIYIATLSTVDPNLYDAAKIDGAGRLSCIIHISLPSLVPIITVQFIMRIGNILSVGFEKIILLYNPLTYSTADVISTYIYRFGLEQANYSFGTAVGLFNSIVNIAVLIGVNSLFRRFSEESLW